MHPGVLASFEMACDKLSDSKSVKKQTAKSALSVPVPTRKQMKMQDCSTPTRPVLMTQDRLDNYIMVSIIYSALTAL